MNGNIAAALTAMARQRPEASAVVLAASGAQRTFRQLDDDSSAVARGLLASGFAPGARVALMVKPGFEFFSLMFGLFKAELIPVLIDPGIGVASLKECLAEAAPEGFIGIPQAHAARLLLGWGRASIRRLVTVGPRWFWGGATLEQIRGAGRNGPALSDQMRKDQVAAILFTSGSTGLPKGAVYRHGNFLAQVELIRRTYRIEPGEVDLPTFAPFALFDPAFGMTAVLPDMDFSRPGSVDPVLLVNALERYRATNMFGSPAVMNRLAELGRPLPPTLRRVLSAGAPVRPAILDGLAKLLPPGVEVFTPYGATESLPVASIGSAEILADTRHGTDEGKGICVGRPVEGVAVSIVEITDAPIEKWEQARVLDAGEVGEVVVRSLSVTREYFHRDGATALAKIRMPDGSVAHRMGDVGYFDERGRLWFCGRKSDRVMTTGATLFTEMIEGIFNTHPRVARTALVGVRRNGTTEPVLCVEQRRVTGPTLRAEDLLALAEKSDVTRPVRTILFHPGFPVDIRHNAKIVREKLAVWAERQLR